MASGFSYAEIILPLALRQTYTYRIPEALKEITQVGKRVIVQFGKRKMYTGIVHSLHDSEPEVPDIKEITSILDDTPVVSHIQLKFWEWMADYYMCSQGEVFKAALPQGLKLESESRIFASENFDDRDSLADEERILFDYLGKEKGVTLKQLIAGSGIPALHSHIQRLLEKKVVFVEEYLRESYSPAKMVFLSLTSMGAELSDPDKLDELSRAPRQKALIEHLLKEESGELAVKEVRELYSPTVIQTLIDKGLIQKTEKELLRSQKFSDEIRKPYQLNDLQKKVFSEIQESFREKDVVLLHGVTSSGKTEIYIDLIRESISRGEQVLYLLPEIALTSQIVERLRKVFGDSVGVFHSKFSDPERVDVYRRQQEGGEEGEYKLILGVRSAIFLPFRNLGLIIIDEEHENTFKQYDPSPRYHARDSAIVLAGFYRAKVLLGTATPSIESYANARKGKYGFTELKERFGGVKMPEIFIADLRKARLKKQMRSVFTPLLIRQMELSLESGKQIILFQNRRGYSSYFECEVCGDIPKCRSCDVSLTYHKFERRLVCHYCGYSQNPPQKCKACGSTRLTTRGFGTELVTDDLELLFPGYRAARLDLDTTRTRKSYEKILGSFAAGETDILVGTQMLSKGLDFDSVGLVGILNADQMLNYPDFRAYERSFQLMSQVSGRAGRKKERGKVIIQTTEPDHPIIRYVIENSYRDFYKAQWEERQNFHYPPFVKMIRIVIKSTDFHEGAKAAAKLGERLREGFGSRVLGPQVPVVGRIKNQYLQHILLKVEKEVSFKKARDLLRKVILETSGHEEFRKVRINLDVDPY